MRAENAGILQLFVLNLLLQIFDGLATYQGIRLGWSEANPLLVFAFAHLGVAPALLLFKAKACGLLTLLYWQSEHPTVPAALALLASAYGLFSFVPWTAKFIGLLL